MLLYLVFTYFEIYQISSHKTEAHRFIFIPSKEAPALHLAVPVGTGCTDFGIRHYMADGAKLRIFLKSAKK